MEPRNVSTSVSRTAVVRLPLPPPQDLRKSENLVPLVGDGNRRRSRVVVSYDPNAIIFEFVVDIRTKSSGDSNLVSGGSGDHVGMAQVGGVLPGIIGSKAKTRWRA